MRIVVTGASGNMGTALLRRLAGVPEIADVVGVARRLPPEASPYDRVSWVSCDVGDPAAVERLTETFRGADAVVHLAWQIQPSQQPATLHRSNVRGSKHVIDAVVAAGVPTLVVASSVGAYDPGPKDRFVDESWPTGGVPGSLYSVQKGLVERLLDDLERARPQLRVVRMRPGLIFQHDAGAQIARYFLGPFVPVSLLSRRRVPVLPLPKRFRVQCVHAADAAEAYTRAVLSPEARGAFNLAVSPVLDPASMAELLHGTAVAVPQWLLTLAAGATWLTRLQPTDPGWLWLARSAPLMDSTRARVELGWYPQYDALTALTDLVDGMAAGAGTGSPALRPREPLHTALAAHLPGHGFYY
jgi:UDP-glucose 4-epimerase